MGPKLNVDEEIQAARETELATNLEMNNRPSESIEVKLVKLDPVKLFQEVEQMRKDGIDEATIRAAFDEVVSNMTQGREKAKSVMKRHIGSVPMPSQEEVNKMFEERYKGIKDESSDPHVALILEAMENSKKARERIVKVPFRTRVAHYIAAKILRMAIFAFRLLGVK